MGRNAFGAALIRVHPAKSVSIRVPFSRLQPSLTEKIGTIGEMRTRMSQFHNPRRAGSII